jgi:hypothetical protein
MKITKINLQHLQNAEHFQFHTDALALMTAATPAALKIAMKKLYKLLCAGVLVGALCAAFVACADIHIENPEKDYYWSGGRKIYLDTDYTKMIISADSEEQLKAYPPATTNPFVGRNMALIDVRDEAVKQKVLADESIKNKIFAHKYSGYDDTPFYMTGDIIMQPKEGVSAEEILSKNEVDAETVTKTDIGVVVRLKDWGKLLSTANAIYESEMVDWCHPDFISMDERMTNHQMTRSTTCRGSARSI